MKIAVAGKGGVGKTTLAGTLARIFSRKGYEVIAVDADPSMNLHTSLGMENPQPIFKFKEMIEKRAVIAPGIYNLNPQVKDIPERYSARDENIMLLVMGTVEKGGEGCICPESSFLKALMRHIVLHRKELLILDTEAGVEHLGRKVAEGFDGMLVIAEPSIKAVETANRIYELSKEIGVERIYCIGNKTNSRDEEKFIEDNIGYKILGFIPYDKAVLEADREGKPLIDNSSSKALKAIEEVAEKITAEIKGEWDA